MKYQDLCSAVIVAAGFSRRMGGEDSKQFLPLCGVPVIVHTLRAFEAAREVQTCVVVCRGEDCERMRSLAEKYGLHKASAFVPGGETRQRSVAAGIAAVPREAGWLAIHDGARPLVTPQEIDGCIRDAREYGASALCVPVKDTLKVTDEAGFVVSTPPRGQLRAVQTPQVFERAAYERALRQAESDGKDYTDDCQLLEHMGLRVHLYPGSYNNIKLTTSGDVPVAEAALRRRGYGMRIGHGYDVHRLEEGRRLVLGGVDIPYPKGLLGHSDADVLTHAVMDALLGAAALGDIGGLFPDTDAAYLGADSLKLLAEVCRLLREKAFRILNIDATVLAQAPKLKPHLSQMCEKLSQTCGIPRDCVNIKATTEEGLGFTGSGEGIAAHAVCLLENR